MESRKNARRAVPVAALVGAFAIGVAGFALAPAGAKPPGFCIKRPSHPQCQTTTTPTIVPTTTAPTTTVESGPVCTRVYTDGTLSAFVASLAPGDTGCAYA